MTILKQHRIHLVAGSILALFSMLLYYHLLFTNRVLANGDILFYFYPYRDYVAEILRSGRIPLWNPYIFSGVPLLANPQTAVLYPFHWPLIWLSVTKQIYWSAAIHTWLLGFGGYLLMRRWGYSIWGGLATGIVLAGSGFYGGLMGHINQMNGAAWLPWIILILESAIQPQQQEKPFRQQLSRMALHSAAFALVVAFMLLAGHTQTAYINLFGLGIWTVWPRISDTKRALFNIGQRLLIYGTGVFIGALLSAPQLLPTLELSDLGLRSGGISYGEASSFSLFPSMLRWTLLPSYDFQDLGMKFNTLGYSEFVAYVGLTGLLLAFAGLWPNRQQQGNSARTLGLLFTLLGLGLALGKWNPAYAYLYEYVPGFDLFRAPARWMMLYTMGMALLAGNGAEYLVRKLTHDFEHGRDLLGMIKPVFAPAMIVCLIMLDLILAARALPHVQTTAPQAVYDLRTAPAHLLTDPLRETLHPAAAGRFLSMSTTTFDPGDMGDYRRIFMEDGSPQLTEKAFNQLIVALKDQEIVAPNLSLLWRIPSVDGFDGGVLPLQRYIRFLTLFIEPEELIPDGRLREQVLRIPHTDLLGLLNVQYVITDKVNDFWFENAYYDRQLGARLSPQGERALTVDIPIPFEATHINLLASVEGGPEVVESLMERSQPVAIVRFIQSDTTVKEHTLTAGGEPGTMLADSRLDSPMAARSGSVVAYRSIDGEWQEYRVTLFLDQPAALTSIEIEYLDSDTPVDLVVQAMTQVDGRTGMFTPLLPSGEGRFQAVHGGDVKLYENLDVEPRVHLRYDVIEVADGQQAVDMLRNGEVAMADVALVEGLSPFKSAAHPDDSVEMIRYEPEQVEVLVSTNDQSLLVLSDSYYPGWVAYLDDEPVPIYATNNLFRGVVVPSGTHTVVFKYQPRSWRNGLLAGALGLLGTVLLCLPAARLRFNEMSV